MNQLFFEDYLLTPNHYSIKSWYISEKYIDEVLIEDCDLEWLKYLSQRGYNILDDNIPSHVMDEFLNEKIEDDYWLSINKELFIVNDFYLSSVFISAFIDELDTEDDEKFKMFIGLITSKKNMFIRFRKFPRRIDLFPIKEISIAQQILEKLNEDGKELFQYTI